MSETVYRSLNEATRRVKMLIFLPQNLLGLALLKKYHTASS